MRCSDEMERKAERAIHWGSPRGSHTGPPRKGLDFAHLTRLKHFAALAQFRAFAPKAGTFRVLPTHGGRMLS